MGNRDTFRKGQLVIALGNPYAQARDGSASASWGMISNISRRPKPSGKPADGEVRRNETIHHAGTLLQVDTRLNIGTSGGALLNLKGELIGITTSLAALSGYESSVGYAVPLDRATRRIVTTLSKGLEVEYGYLGIAPGDVTPKSRSRLPARLKRRYAAMASNVHPNSAAAQGGLRPGDVFLNIDGKPVYNRYDLMRLIGLTAPGTRVRLDIWRESGSRRLTLFVRLGKWPVINDDEIIATAFRFPAWRGIRVDHETARHKFLQQPFRYHHAVVVLHVTNPALKKNFDLQPGDYVSHVNDSAVQTPAEFHAAVRNLKGAVTLRLISGNRVRVPE